MTDSKQDFTNGNEYEFAGTIFHIGADELAAAVEQSRRLHGRLLDDLMINAKRHAKLLGARSKNGRQEKG